MEQATVISFAGRCYSARAGRLEEALVYATRARQAGDVLNNARLRALRVMESEPYLYQGNWEAVVRVVEEYLPAAWEIREWPAILFSSAWLAIAYLKLGKLDNAKGILDRVFREAPLRTFIEGRGAGTGVWGFAFVKIALAKLHLAAGDTGQALEAAHDGLSFAQRHRLPSRTGRRPSCSR